MSYDTQIEHHVDRGGPTSRPAGRTAVLLAGALDQLVLVAVVLLGFGSGLLAADAGGGGVAIGAGIAAAMVGLVVCVAAQIGLAVRTGATAGLFLLGLRTNPARPCGWDDAFEWLLSFWQHLVLMPVVWLSGRRRHPDDVVLDPRARAGGARLARLLLAAALLASPVPAVLAYLA